ncbi:MAG: hypothetical protein JWO55_292 [Candidatus Saccharibacteria bacterium]|nr:hypothetical protein [Candidatus Saccharibacteria bacterium]
MKLKLLLFISLITGSLSLSFLLSTSTFASTPSAITPPMSLLAESVVTPTPTPDPGSTPATEPKSTCQVEGIGWIICPLAKEASKIVDAAYAFVASLLVVQPLTTTGASAPVYGAWSIMRNFANVAFVIAFLIIIFSQLTSVGLNNYGIKKMLPRLIVAAILVNASFWICAIAVDISNILGASLNSLFESMEAGLPKEKNTDGIADGTGWEGITGIVLAGGVGIALYVGLSALLPALLAAFLAIVTVFLVLTLRQALVILLIVISPLAFVAYLLPNTESLFKKWLGLFKTMLLMYPIIAMIFGASALASVIVMQAAEGPYKVAVQIMGALVAIIPLALTPIVMKSAGGILNRFGGVVNNPNKGPFDRMKKGAEGMHKRQEGRRAIRDLNGNATMGFGKYRRAAKRERIEGGIEGEKKRAANQYIAGQVMNNQGFANKAAGGLNIGGPSASPDALERALSGAKFVVQQAELEEVKAERAKVEHMDASQLMGVINAVDEKGEASNSPAKIAAAIERLVDVGSTEDVAKVVDKVGTEPQGENISIVNRILAESLAKSGPQFLKASDHDNIRRGMLGQRVESTDENGQIKITDIAGSMDAMAKKNIEDGVYSQEKMVVAPNDELQYANAVATPDGKQRLTNTASELMSSEVLRGKIKHNATSIEGIAKQMPATVNANVIINNTSNSTPPPINTNPTLGRTTPPNMNGYQQQGGLFIPHGTGRQPTTNSQSQPPTNPPQPPAGP